MDARLRDHEYDRRIKFTDVNDDAAAAAAATDREAQHSCKDIAGEGQG